MSMVTTSHLTPIKKFQHWHSDASAPNDNCSVISTLKMQNSPHSCVVELTGVNEDALLFNTDVSAQQDADAVVNCAVGSTADLTVWWAHRGCHVSVAGSLEISPPRAEKDNDDSADKACEALIHCRLKPNVFEFLSFENEQLQLRELFRRQVNGWHYHYLNF